MELRTLPPLVDDGHKVPVKLRRVLTVFVASPNDVLEERLAVKTAAARVNRMCEDLGWYVEVVGYEDELPDLGRAQALIDPAVEHCDVFVGVLWKRWGRPTGTHSSGFEEEFEIAVRRRKTGTSPDILIYLRDLGVEAAPWSRDQEGPPLDPQLQKVLEFRQMVVDRKMLLYKRYSTPAGFEVDVIEHLTRLILRRVRKSESQLESPGAD